MTPSSVDQSQQNQGLSNRLHHEMPFGAKFYPAEPGKDRRVRFQLWAPSAKSVDLLVDYKGQERVIPLDFEESGWYALQIEGLTPGSRYAYRINGKQQVPDPASRFQPDDVHGKSELVDPEAYEWQVTDWQGLPWAEAVLYELHVGTFSPEGTYQGVIDKLDYLKSLGINAIEIMPLADFPGKANWGYDGALWYAPDSTYGCPEDLKRLVDEAHRRGMMVILDVVYNHFGPEGNYISQYAAPFFSRQHKTPWGAAPDLDGPGRYGVRQFIIHNALYWLEEYNMDGLRLDAVQTLRDYSEKHLLYALADEIRQNLETRPDGAKRHIHLILENPANQARFLKRHPDGTPLHYDAQWSEDVCHSFHILLTGETHAVLGDYAHHLPHGAISHLGRALAEGFSFQGETSYFQGGRPIGESAQELEPTALVSYLQTHDQCGNRSWGERIHQLLRYKQMSHPETGVPDSLGAALTAWLLSPQIPMLWMGEEWLSERPFLFFTDLEQRLKKSIREGRRDAYFRHETFRSKEELAKAPDPCDLSSRDASRLDWENLEQSPHREAWQTYQKLLTLRKEKLIPRLSAGAFREGGAYQVLEGRVLGVQWTLSADELWQLWYNPSDQPLSFPDPNREQFKVAELIGESYSGLWQGVLETGEIPGLSSIILLIKTP